MRTDANRLAIHAVRTILDGARSMELTIAGVRVACSVSRGPVRTWPAKGVTGLDEAVDGPWPLNVDIECAWPEGKCALVARCQYVRGHGRYRHNVALELGVRENNQSLVWINVATPLGETEDGKSFRLHGNVSLAKVKGPGDPLRNRRVNHVLKQLAVNAGLPLLSSSKVHIGDVELPELTVLPSPEVVFRHALHLALLKLEFIDRGPKAGQRGKPLVDVEEQLRASANIPLASEDDDDEPDDDDENEEPRERRYWAGGIQWGGESKLDAFREGSYWQVGWSRAATDPTALAIWKLFDQVRIGDWLAIKGYGGRHDLVVHFVGEVLAIDAEAGRVDLRELSVPHYRGKAPSGPGAGSWFDALVPITRPDVIAALFREHTPPAPVGLPLNLILYGPPGTGKTYHMQTALSARFADGGQHHYDFLTFHQAYSYEDFIEGIRPRVSAGDGAGRTQLLYELEDGVFKRAVQAALRRAGFDGTIDEFCGFEPARRAETLASAAPYAVFIDEINRGNVARIFGELISLLEPDKRLGADNELIVTLPCSRTRFGVPKNLHVIGTMNTADRSVEALDTALRRRFDFDELPPRPDLLDFTIEGQIDPAELLRTINRRLEKLYDRDHTIGHSYLMPLKETRSLDGLKRVFKRAILPLLQEYFFGDWGKIGLVLGRDFVRRRDSGAVGLADFEHDDRDALDERPTWELASVDELTSLSFRRIYGDVGEDA